MKRYEKYKDSGIEWIGEVPEGWELNRLKYYLSLLTDGTHQTPNYIDKGVPFLSIKDMSDGHLNFEEVKYISEEEHQELSKHANVKKGDILFSRIGTLGVFVKVDVDIVFDIFVSLGLMKIIPNTINTDYLVYYLSSSNVLNYINLVKAGEGTSAAKFNLGDVANTIIAVPTISEQRKIAEYLDYKVGKIDKAVEGINAQIEDLKGYRQSVISEAVTKGHNRNVKMKDSGVEWIGEIPEGWVTYKMKYLVTQITTPSNSLRKIGLENIESKTGKYIPTDTEFEGNGVEFKIDDIVYGKLRPYLQKVWKAEFDGNAIGDFYVYRSKNIVIPSFMKYVFLSDTFTSIANGSTYGAKMPRVSSDFIADVVWPITTKEEQKAIVEYLDKKTGRIDKAIKALEMQREDLGALKQSVISEAVTGKVDVRGWNVNKEN